MQTPFSIPPLTEEGVQHLVGLRASFKRASNPERVWWGEIVEVRYINPQSAAVKIEGHSKSGKDKWHSLADIRFTNHCDEPLLISMRRVMLDTSQQTSRNR
jgi:hypothetical protein